MRAGFGERTAERRDPVSAGEPNVAQRRGREQREGLAVDGQLPFRVPAHRAAVQISVEVIRRLVSVSQKQTVKYLIGRGRSR